MLTVYRTFAKDAVVVKEGIYARIVMKNSA